MSPGCPAGDRAGCGREGANSKEAEGGLAASQSWLHGHPGLLRTEKRQIMGYLWLWMALLTHPSRITSVLVSEEGGREEELEGR